jgi:hypothetical protein
MKSKIVFSLALSFACSASFALEAFVGKVVLLEPTYLPGLVTFMMDTGNSSCPSGTWLKWQKNDTQNNKAVYATLLTAVTSGKSVRFHINDGDRSCQGQYIHIMN